MRIAHIISSIDESTGGPARSSTSLVHCLLENDRIERIELFTLVSNNPVIYTIESKKGKISFYKPSIFKKSLQLESDLNSGNNELFHGHGIWDIVVSQMAKIARRRKIPYIISIRGMLEPWSLQQSKTKKKVAMLLYQDKDLKNATCLHATANMEAKSIRDMGYKNPIAIIPNGIDLNQYPLKDFSIKKKKRKVLFLSRIHPKKGIEYLIDAWEKLDGPKKSEWEVEIAGNGDDQYLTKLNSIIDSKSLGGSIKITGAKFGQEKIDAYHSADIFVLPTHSENFGIVIAEALSCGVPVITTTGTPWEDIRDCNAGDWIEVGSEPLLKSLSKMIDMEDSELQQMGINGRMLINRKYSIVSVAAQFYKLYNWILNKGDKPDFII